MAMVVLLNQGNCKYMMYCTTEMELPGCRNVDGNSELQGRMTFHLQSPPFVPRFLNAPPLSPHFCDSFPDKVQVGLTGKNPHIFLFSFPLKKSTFDYLHS